MGANTHHNYISLRGGGTSLTSCNSVFRHCEERSDVAIAMSINNNKIPEQVRDDEYIYANKIKHVIVPLALRDDENTFPRPLGRGIKGEGLPHSKKAAFTLAEVLITLSIIGIVAALTIPTLISSIQNKQLEVGLKNAYATLAEALKMYEHENGYPATPANLGTVALKPILMKYIKNIKDCGIGATDPDKACIPNKAYVDDPENYNDIYMNYNGTNTISYASFDDGQFVMNNGMLVLINNPGAADQHIYISVDINGYNKSPNRLGQDLFMFQIIDNGQLLPMGAKNTYITNENTYCSDSSSNNMNGAVCTYKALNDKDFFKNSPK